MSGRAVDYGFRMLTAVAVLLSMVVAPIQLTNASLVSPQSNRPRRVLAILESKNNGKCARSAPSSMSEADSLHFVVDYGLDADVEDELIRSSPPAAPFGVFHAPFLATYDELVSFAVPLAARPLRC